MNTPTGSTLISINNVSKKFGTSWIFRNITASFGAGKKYAITGPNGSGKSTLLKIIAGMVTPNEGQVHFSSKDIYKHISFCSPYMELPEELTIEEILVFHQHLRKLTISQQQFIDHLGIDEDKEVRNYSSGMKQRLKLALAFFTKSDIMLLDEPTSNLDEHWSNWYKKMVEETPQERTIIVSSNIPAEYNFCSSVLNMADYIKK